jgi:hypothetical protein
VAVAWTWCSDTRTIAGIKSAANNGRTATHMSRKTIPDYLYAKLRYTGRCRKMSYSLRQAAFYPITPDAGPLAYHPGVSDYTALILSLISHQDPDCVPSPFGTSVNVAYGPWPFETGSPAHLISLHSFAAPNLRPDTATQARSSTWRARLHHYGIRNALLISAKTGNVRRSGHSSFACVGVECLQGFDGASISVP